MKGGVLEEFYLHGDKRMVVFSMWVDPDVVQLVQRDVHVTIRLALEWREDQLGGSLEEGPWRTERHPGSMFQSC